MLQFHGNMSPVQRIIATRVKQKCIHVHVVEKSKLLSPLLMTTGTAVTSDKYHDVRVRLISKKWSNIQEASG